MPRPKGSKNKPKTDGAKAPAKSKAVKKVVTKPSPVMKKEKAPVAKKEVKSQPETKVNAPVLEPETPAATGPKTRAAAGKNTGEAVIRPVDDDESDGVANTVVIQGGNAILRKSSSNPDLE